jgi:hypothetical protein
MACINPDGTLTPTGRLMLFVMPGPSDPEPMSIDALSQKSGVPLYRVRASIREFLGAGLVSEESFLYRRTAAAEEALARAGGSGPGTRA